jgi:hypothetical protein
MERGGISRNEACATPTDAKTDPPTCDHCGLAHPAPNQVAIDGKNLWLHRRCEAGWLDQEIPTFLLRSAGAA